MSNQSGISAEQALLDTLGSSEFGPNGLIIVTGKISDNSQAVEFKNRFNSVEELQSSLREDPVYVFIKDQSSSKPYQYHFISYIPDTSHVRLKMLYASTKNTLVRQIGTNSINKQVLYTEPNEFLENLEDNGSDSHAVLSDRERSSLAINEQQRELKLSQQLRGHALVSQTDGAPNSLAFDVISGDSSISDKLNQNNVISFRIDSANEKVQVLNETSIIAPEDLNLIVDHPSYTIYKNGELFYFIYSCPSGSKVKDRMLYASNRTGFINYLKDNEKMNFAKVLEIGEPDDLEISLISQSSESEQKAASAADEESTNSSQRFNKPRGPARKRKA